jgi:hypothetical protein
VASSGYPREEIPVLTGVREESSSILHSTYATLVVSISLLLMGRAPGCSTTAGAIPLSDTPIIQYCMIIIYLLW